jgi:hypothetical protein
VGIAVYEYEHEYGRYGSIGRAYDINRAECSRISSCHNPSALWISLELIAELAQWSRYFRVSLIRQVGNMFNKHALVGPWAFVTG